MQYIKLSFILLITLFLQLSFSQSLGSYAVDSITYQEAVNLLHSEKPTYIQPNPHPDAQWYTTAHLGWMLHWGIHSVLPTEPSWALMFDTPWGNNDHSVKQDTYYSWAAQFNPQNYDPDQWIAAIKKAGFTYAVITTKHHDGYALWPTKYGNMNTRVYMEGRDLIAKFVEACRKYGIKVGFYFSMPDWHYPGFRSSLAAIGDDGEWHWGLTPPQVTPSQDSALFKSYYAYNYGQLKELLTNYGKIDLLWFDGLIWPTIGNWGCSQTKSWIRSLQPGIVMNDRYCEGGDFTTYEINKPNNPPSSWWEYVNTWGGGSGWGTSYWFGSGEELINIMNTYNAQGGNYLANASPTLDGSMVPMFYDRINNIADLRFPQKAPPTTAPEGFTALPGNKKIDLQWHSLAPSSILSSGLSGYRIFRNGELYRFTSDTSFSDTGLDISTTYIYEVAALNLRDSAGPKTEAITVTTFGIPTSTNPNISSGIKVKSGLQITSNGRQTSLQINASHAYSIQLFSITGQFVKSYRGKTANDLQISPTQLSHGIYFCNAVIDGIHSSNYLFIRK